MVRVNYGVQPVILDNQLEILANNRAVEIYKTGQTNHNGWKSYFKNTNCYYAGENFSRGYSVGNSYIGQMESETHRNNILMSRYDTIGIGIHKTIIVELFCDIDKNY